MQPGMSVSTALAPIIESQSGAGPRALGDWHRGDPLLLTGGCRWHLVIRTRRWRGAWGVWREGRGDIRLLAVQNEALEGDRALRRTREIQVVVTLDERDLERLGFVPPSNGVKDWHGL